MNNSQHQLQFEPMGEHAVRFSGVLSHQTLKPLMQFAHQHIQAHQTLQCYFSDVTQVDSVGVAALLDWMRRAKRLDCQLSFHQVPDQMQAIIAVSHLKEILPIKNGASHG